MKKRHLRTTVFFCTSFLGPLVSTVLFAASDWHAEWNKTLAAARQEGKVVIGADLGGDKVRRAMTETFERKYGISVDFSPLPGTQLAPRVASERQAGVYAWDLFFLGTSTLLTRLKPVGALDPIEAALILPEVKDPAKWVGNELPFFDKERRGLAFLLVARQSLFVNTKLIGAGELKTYRDLLSPKWNGKILLGRNPANPGYTQAMFQFFYQHKELGPGYIRELAAQNLKTLDDDRQAVEWLAQGRYVWCFCNAVLIERFIEEGMPIQAVDPRKVKEGGYVTSSFGNVALANRAPHPNAARIYLNWILSPEGQTLYSKASGDPSRRADVAKDHVRPWEIPEQGWLATHTEEAIGFSRPLVALLKEIMPN
jgi:iron(III) transport system substrate-binding protein